MCRAVSTLFTLVVVAACHVNGKETTPPVNTVQPVQPPGIDATVKPVPDTSEIQAIRNDRIQFVTMRPPGSTTPTLDRRVVLKGPPEALALATRGDIGVLDALIPLLADSDRAWAAEVMLAAMTGHEADIVNSFQASPDEYFESVGGNGQQRWQAWLDDKRPLLRWNAELGQFTTR